jgi:hypothetical protein
MVGDARSLADLLLAAHLSMFALAPEGAAILREHENLTSCPFDPAPSEGQVGPEIGGIEHAA